LAEICPFALLEYVETKHRDILTTVVVDNPITAPLASASRSALFVRRQCRA
jgi:hypothetical protein